MTGIAKLVEFLVEGQGGYRKLHVTQEGPKALAFGPSF